MQASKYRPQIQMESCMSGVIFLSSLPNGAYLHLTPPFPSLHVPSSGLYLKENGTSLSFFCCTFDISLSSLATEVEGTFRVNGSNKRMRDLQAAFETAPRVCILQ